MWGRTMLDEPLLCPPPLSPATASPCRRMQAVSDATGRSPKDVKSAADEKGDLGEAAELSRAKQRTLFGSVTSASGACAAAWGLSLRS